MFEILIFLTISCEPQIQILLNSLRRVAEGTIWCSVFSDLCQVTLLPSCNHNPATT